MTSSNVAARQNDARLAQAVEELIGLVRRGFPEAIFDVTEGDDPPGIYVWARIDVENGDEVIDLVIDRLLELQVDEGLPVYLIPTRPDRAAVDRIQRERARFDYLFRPGVEAQ